MRARLCVYMAAQVLSVHACVGERKGREGVGWGGWGRGVKVESREHLSIRVLFVQWQRLDSFSRQEKGVRKHEQGSGRTTSRRTKRVRPAYGLDKATQEEKRYSSGPAVAVDKTIIPGKGDSMKLHRNSHCQRQ